MEPQFLRRLLETQTHIDRILRDTNVTQIASSITSIAEQMGRSGIGINESLALTAERMRKLTDPIDSFQKLTGQTLQAFKPIDLASIGVGMRDVGFEFLAATALANAASLSVRTIDFDRLGLLISTAFLPRQRVQVTTNRLARRHVGLVSTLEPARPSLPSFVAEMPATSMFVHTEAVRAVTPHGEAPVQERQDAQRLRDGIYEETIEFVEEALSELKPAFLQQYRGARQCAVTKGPDWWSQGAASMRKLMKGVLHTVATDELVLPFVKDPKTQIDRLGHPTRATKIAWLCQFLRGDEYRRFVHAELTAGLALIELLDAANHKDEFPDFENQYAIIALRVDVIVRHLLTLWKARNSN